MMWLVLVLCGVQEVLSSNSILRSRKSLLTSMPTYLSTYCMGMYIHMDIEGPIYIIERSEHFCGHTLNLLLQRKFQSRAFVLNYKFTSNCTNIAAILQLFLCSSLTAYNYMYMCMHASLLPRVCACAAGVK